MSGKAPVMVRVNEAKALSDEVRVFILDLLSRKPMSVNEIAEELKKRGLYKNINTVRYHLQVLKEAGLVRLVATKEVKGGVLKYYAAERRVYPFEVPEDLEERLRPVAELMSEGLKELVLRVLRERGDLILEVAKTLKPCPYCVTKHFAEYVVLEALRIAAGRVMHDGEVRRELERFRVEGEAGGGR